MKNFVRIFVLYFLFFLFNTMNSTNVLDFADTINEATYVDLFVPLAWAENLDWQGKDKSTHSLELTQDYIIGQGDQLEIVVWRNEQLSRRVVVRPDGRISLPLIQDLQAEGLSVLQLQNQIKERLNEHIIDPKVSVIVAAINSYKVSVLGRVVTPGVYPITGNTTIAEAIALAGGFTEWANKRKITVVTQLGGKEEKLIINYKKIASGEDPKQNIVLKRGDIIIVP